VVRGLHGGPAHNTPSLRSDDVTWMKRNFTLSAQHLREGRFHTLITCLFSHNEANRLIASTAPLFLVAVPAVAVLGQARFAGLYLAGGLVSAAAGLAIASQSEVGMLWRVCTLPILASDWWERTRVQHKLPRQ